MRYLRVAETYQYSRRYLAYAVAFAMQNDPRVLVVWQFFRIVRDCVIRNKRVGVPVFHNYYTPHPPPPLRGGAVGGGTNECAAFEGDAFASSPKLMPSAGTM